MEILGLLFHVGSIVKKVWAMIYQKGLKVASEGILTIP